MRNERRLIKMNSKKAQSEIITTVLIILLVLAAIIIVWQVVQSTIKTTQKNIDYNKLCLGSQLSIVKAVASNASASGSIIVTRDPASGNDNNVTARVFVNGAQNPAISDSLGVYGKTTITVNSSVGDEVKVAPVLDVDNYLCPSTSTAKVTAS